LIVGAGISGLGGAYHLTHQCPGTNFVVLEEQEGFGGTWRTHRYPGIRSDSDLYTFGYRFKPWTGTPIATAAESCAIWARSSRTTISLVTFATATESHRPLGRALKTCGRSTRSGSTPASVIASPAIFCGCARAITGIPRDIRRSGVG